MLVSRHAELIEFARRFRDYGKPDYEQPGLNFRMSEFTAALGIVGVERLDEITAWKNAVARELLDPPHPNRVAAPRRNGLGALQVHRLRPDRALDRQGLRRAVPPTHSATRSTCRTPTGSRRTTGACRSTTARRRAGLQAASQMRVLVTGGSGFIGSHVVDRLARTATSRSSSTSCTRRTTRRRGRDGHRRHHRPRRDAPRGARMRRGHPPRRGRGRQRGRRRPDSRRPRQRARHAGRSSRPRGTRRSHASSTAARSGSTATRRRRRRSTRTRRSRCPRTSTRRRSSPARCTAARTTRCTAREHTILRFGIPYGPRARPAAVVPSFVAARAARRGADDRRRRTADAPVRLRRGPRRRHRRGLRPRPPAASTTSSATRRRACARSQTPSRELVAAVPIVHGPERPADVHIGRISGARAAAELGWQPRPPFADGVRRYVDWLARDERLRRSRPPRRARSPERGRRPPPGVRRAVVVGVVQQHDVAAVEHARRAGGDRLGRRARLPVPPPARPQQRLPAEPAHERGAPAR